MDHTTPPPESRLPPEPPKAESAAHDEAPDTTHETPTPSKRPKLHRDGNPFRLLLLVIIGFASLFLLIRTLAVEPFGVPTGSMAPSLIGHHRDGPCPRCGYTVRVGRPSSGNLNEFFSHVVCPNCDYRFSLASAPDVNGDRLLVDKNVYEMRRPRRWEMVVFRCPDTDPKENGKPYVKRLIGLPGEMIKIIDGDIYVFVKTDTKSDFEIVRKGLAEVRETMIPVFDMAFPPKPDGWRDRWVVTAEPDPRLPANMPGNKAIEPTIEGNSLILDASESPQAMTSVTYRNWHLDGREEPIRVWNAYDGEPRNFGQLPPAHDFILTCEVEVTATTSDGEASFACRLVDGADSVAGEISVGPRSSGRAQLIRETQNAGPLGSASGVSLVPGKKYRLEFAFVDRRVHFALDGKLVMAAADLPSASSRNEVRRPLYLGARGCRIVIRDLKLHRDIHYTQYGEHGTRHPATLGPKEYFVLGDNSGNSQDSRKWPTPGVPEDDFIGKPFLIHQPLKLSRTTIGGRERVFQTLDWSRLRWLH